MRKLLALLALIAALGVGVTAGPAYAGDVVRVAQEETDNGDDDGTDYGWIGLLGLAGLAGLLGRKRNDRDADVRARSMGTTGTGTTTERRD